MGPWKAPLMKIPGREVCIGIDRICLAESVIIKLDAELGRQALEILGRIHPDRQHHHVEFFLFDSILVGGVADRHILASWDFPPDGYVAADKPDPRQLFRSLVEPFEILSIGTDIVVEDRALRVGIMVFRQDHLLLRVRAAYGGAVTVAAGDDLPRADAVDPGDLVRMLPVGPAPDLPFVRTGSAQQPFKSRLVTTFSYLPYP